MLPIARALAGLCLLASTGLVAQTWTFPLNPRATYLRTSNDSEAPALILDLATLGILPGQWLRIGTTGAYVTYGGGADGYRSLVGVFSNGSVLLPTDQPHRVPGAIPAGPAVRSGPTLSGSLPIDIAEDFDCSRFGWASSMDVVVPAGATHLFLGVHESWHADNSDPNGDYAAVVTMLPTPTLPGTGEHLTLLSTVGGAPAQVPDVHVAPPGSTLSTQVRYPVGLIDGSIYAFVADVIATGTPPLQPIPGWWTPNLIWLQIGVLPASPNWSATWSVVATADFPGTTVLVQAVALTDQARNGLFEATHAHAFAWQ